MLEGLRRRDRDSLRSGYEAQILVERALELRRLADEEDLPVVEVVAFVTRDVVAQHMLIDDHDVFPLLKNALQQEQVELS